MKKKCMKNKGFQKEIWNKPIKRTWTIMPTERARQRRPKMTEAIEAQTQTIVVSMNTKMDEKTVFDQRI